MSFYSDLLGESTINSNNVYTDSLQIGSDLDLTQCVVIGDVIPQTDNTYDIGSTSKKWANIYANNSFSGPSISVNNIYNYTPGTNILFSPTAAIVKINSEFEVVSDSFFDNDLNIVGTLFTDEIQSYTAANPVRINDSLVVAQELKLDKAINQMIIQPNGTGTFYTIRANGNPTTNRTLEFPNVSDGIFLLDNGDFTINGQFSFNNNVNLPLLNASQAVVTDASKNLTSLIYSVNNTYNSLVQRGTIGQIIGTSYFSELPLVSFTAQSPGQNSSTLSFPISPSANISYFFPNTGINCNIIVSESNQTINGTKTFSSTLNTNGISNTGDINNSNNVLSSGILCRTITSLNLNNDLDISANGTGRINFNNNVYLPLMASSRCLVTNSSKQLSTLEYSYNTNFASTLLQRSSTGYSESLGFYSHLPSQPFSCKSLVGGFDYTLVFQDFPSSSCNYNYPFPNVTNCNMLLSEGTQTINGTNSFTSTINANNGILLPTTGGSASNLNFYEEYSFSTTFTVSSGANSVSYTIRITRCGNVCNIYCPTISMNAGITANNNIISNTAFVSRLRPAAQRVLGRVRISDNGVVTDGLFSVTAGGGLAIYKNISLGNFNGTSNNVSTLDTFTGNWLFNL